MTVRAKPMVMVVDDTPAMIRLMQTILEPAGYEVITAADGPAALQLVESLRPDLILLDVVMPGMDGYAVCDRLKSTEMTRAIPIIFVTASDDADAEARGLAMGAVDFVSKPINVPVVLARVRTHLALYRHSRSVEGMFRDVVEFAPDAFILLDEQDLIVRVNHRTEQLFGYSRDQLIGQPMTWLVPELDRMAASADVQCLRMDGTAFPAEISLSPMETAMGTLLMVLVRDVTERRQAERELSDSRQRLRDMTARSEVTREGERKHIAREIHDELGQVLTALRMEISFVEMRFGALDSALPDRVSTMKTLVDRAIRGVRSVSANLRPPALNEGLVSALEWLCSEFTRHTGTPCVFSVADADMPFDETRSIVVFRIVQESLTNISRHARASQATVSLERRGSVLCVSIADDGSGFDLGAVDRRRTFGLLGMRERAIALGGSLDVEARPGHGTVVRLSIPAELDPDGGKQ
jgi:PAS domain S-box-containing protein